MKNRRRYKRSMKIKKGWQVEWCEELPLDKNGDTDWDAAKYVYADFDNLLDAEILAEKKCKTSVFKEAWINEFYIDEDNNFQYTGKQIEIDDKQLYLE